MWDLFFPELGNDTRQRDFCHSRVQTRPEYRCLSIWPSCKRVCTITSVFSDLNCRFDWFTEARKIGTLLIVPQVTCGNSRNCLNSSLFLIDVGPYLSGCCARRVLLWGSLKLKQVVGGMSIFPNNQGPSCGCCWCGLQPGGDSCTWAVRAIQASGSLFQSSLNDFSGLCNFYVWVFYYRKLDKM